jgi:hypothetical protein
LIVEVSFIHVSHSPQSIYTSLRSLKVLATTRKTIHPSQKGSNKWQGKPAGLDASGLALLLGLMVLAVFLGNGAFFADGGVWEVVVGTV